MSLILKKNWKLTLIVDYNNSKRNLTKLPNYNMIGNMKNLKIDYKYNEDMTLKELCDYIDNTYGEHYSRNRFQATEFIIDGGHGEGFCIGNILKYAQRYGKKGGKNRSDLLKVIHYGIMALYNHDLDNGDKELDDLGIESEDGC